MKLKESIYNIKINMLNDKILLYNSLSRALCLLEPEDVRQLDKLNTPESEQYENNTSALNGEYKQLCEQGFVLPDQVNEFEITKNLYRQSRFDSSSINLTICTTLACNFGCDYCFQGLDKSLHVMGADVKDGIIAMYRKILQMKPDLKKVQFVWYGGEPLVKKDVLYELADRLINISAQSNIDYSAVMVSNGSLLTKQVAQELFLRGLKMVQITLDGSEEFHDARRYYLSKKGSYQRILGNIEEWIDEVPISVNIRVNIDERNKGDIRNLIDDLVKRGLSHKKNFRMYFSPVEAMTQGCHNVSDKTIQKMSYGQLEGELNRYAFERGLMELPYLPSFLGICSAMRPLDYIIVPNGDAHKCWDTVSFPDRKVGSIFELDELFGTLQPNPKKEPWDKFDPFVNEICSSCKILPNCASYCAHKFIHAADAAGESVLPCPPMKYSLNERLILKAEKEGFITGADYDPIAVKTDPYSLTPKMHTVESMKKIPVQNTAD